MPSQRLPFGAWLPDERSLANPGSITAKNVVPNGDLFLPFYGLQTTSNTALSAYARGAISVSDSAGNEYTYAGDATKLYSLAGTGWSDVSRTSGAYTSGAITVWDFAKYGDKVIATNSVDEVQIITMGGANFENLGGSPPKASSVAVVGDFVVLANTDDSETTVRWSGFGDETAWTPSPTTQSDVQQIAGNYGSIVRIIGGDKGNVFFERGIVRMEREGPPTTFGFYPAERKRGAISFGSVCDAGNVMFYISNDDLYIFDGEQSQNLGSGKVARWFFQDADPAYYSRISSAADLKRSLILWSYVGADAQASQPNKILIYHWPSGTFSVAEIETNALHAYVSSGYTLDGLDAISGSLDALTASLDDPVWAQGRINIGAFNSSNNSGVFEGTPLTAVLESKEFDAQPGRIAYVDQTRPIIEGPTSTITVEHGYRANQRDEVSYDASVSINNDGAFDIRRSARFHRVRVTIAGGFEKAFGVDLRAKINGQR